MPDTELKLNVVPAHLGESLVGAGTGNGLIVTLVVALALHPFEFVTVKVYTPFAAVVTLLILGVCNDDVNEFGPLHA
jgi:hypothetical protein